MTRNNRTNSFIKWGVIIGDFLLLNALLYTFRHHHPSMIAMRWEIWQMFLFICNFALLLSEWHNHTVIHERVVTVVEILRRSIMLVITYTLIAYLIIKAGDVRRAVGWLLISQGCVYFVLIIITRFFERMAIKHYRKMGGNSRSVVFVGSDSELKRVYKYLNSNPTMGYRLSGYYANEVVPDVDTTQLGTLDYLMENLENLENLTIGDEMFVCLSRLQGDKIRALARFCEKNLVQFYFLPISLESIHLNFSRQFLDEIEVFTTHDSPLSDPVNNALKRLTDIVMSLIFLIPTAILFPLIYVIIKLQSPGPILFKQQRTGLDGKNFMMLKFRSMHVNKDADKLQATKNDPRKYPFGNFMRKTNIDELPQFLNVLQGNMSIVGPRPHMLAHTKQYSELIDKYMVRHFVKPGITGWAQVTGFRGETKELWQMEERVKRDIWYIEHWSFWLDIRIIWLTMKTFFVHDKNAY